MNKLMKKISAFLAMLLLVLTFIPTGVSAAETDGDEKTAVCVKVPDDWSDPCVWAWAEDGTNAFEAWPGEEAEAYPENEGWYYIWVPSWANHVIVNANAGEVQTDELILEGGNAWITVEAADAVEVSYEQQTTGEIPEYVEKFVVHAQVDESWTDPCIWAWSAPDGTNAFEAWPGRALSAEEDGWYSAKVPVWVNSIIINANEGEVQTEDISIDAAEVWITVDAEGTSDFSYVDPNKEEVPNITVHIAAPADWEAPCLWAWSAPDGTNVYGTWPGEAFEEGDDGWLTKEIPGWVNSVIVNANEGTVQTQDITVETGRDIWLVITDAETYKLSYEEPALDAAAGTEEAAADTEEAATADTTADDGGEDGSNTALIVVIVVIVVILAAAVIVVIVKKNKK